MERAIGADDGSDASVMDLPPVRDLHGNKVWRIKVASERERTCLDCGETTVEEYCLRCVAEAETNQRHNLTSQVGRRLVPTLSYLKPGEYERNGS